MQNPGGRPGGGVLCLELTDALDEPLRMIWSISLIELTSGYEVNISYISGMNVFRISTSFGFVQWKI